MASLVTAIDIGANNVKIVSLRKTGKGLRLVGAGIGSVANLDRGSSRYIDAMAKVIKRTIRENGIPLGEVVVGLPGRGTMIRYVAMPVMPPWKLDLAMSYEVEEQVGTIEGGVEQISYDYARLNIHGFDEDQLPLMLALAQMPMVEERLAIAKQGARRAEEVDLQALGAFNLFRLSPQCQEEEISLLLDIGAEESHLSMQRGEDLFFVRTIASGGRRNTQVIQKAFSISAEQAEELKLSTARLLSAKELENQSEQVTKIHQVCFREVGGLCQSIRGSLQFFYNTYKTHSLKPTKLYITGGGSLIPGLEEAVGQRLRMDVERFDPVAGLQVQSGRVQQALDEDGGAHLATAAGLAAGRLGEGVRLSLLPKQVKERRDFWSRRVFAYYVAALMLLMLGLLIYHARRDAHYRQERNSLWRGQLAAAEKKHAEFETLETRNRRLAVKANDLTRREQSGLDLARCLLLLRTLTPENIFFTRFTTAGYIQAEAPGSGARFDTTFQGRRQALLVGHVLAGRDKKTGKPEGEVGLLDHLDRFRRVLLEQAAIKDVEMMRAEFVPERTEQLEALFRPELMDGRRQKEPPPLPGATLSFILRVTLEE